MCHSYNRYNFSALYRKYFADQKTLLNKLGNPERLKK